MNKNNEFSAISQSEQPFLAGVIEGFYGLTWPHTTRLAYAEYLQAAGLNTYLYSPKSDSTLRREWTSRWSDGQYREMEELASTYQQRNILWGVGLSPFELYRHYGPKERSQLRDKVEYLGELEAPLMAILFDDMPGDLDALAARQAEIVSDVQRWLPAVRLLVCPTYYSYDPVLERFFGAMPQGYWGDLGSQLPESVEIFWTGNAVCSPSIVETDLAGIVSELGRPVTLWDNYPVNDSKLRCDHLYTKPLAGRSSALRPFLRGHLCNPMNQGLLSLPALSGLSALHGTGALDTALIESVLGADLWQALAADADSFETLGRIGLGEQACTQLAEKYSRFGGVAAQEVVGWLEGEFAFDPACLTD